MGGRDPNARERSGWDLHQRRCPRRYIRRQRCGQVVVHSRPIRREDAGIKLESQLFEKTDLAISDVTLRSPIADRSVAEVILVCGDSLFDLLLEVVRLRDVVAVRVEMELTVEFVVKPIDHVRVPLDRASDGEDRERNVERANQLHELIDVLERQMVVSGFVEVPVVLEVERETDGLSFGRNATH